MCNPKNQIRLLTCLMLSTGVNAWPGQEERVACAAALIPKCGDVIISQGKLSLIRWCLSRQILLPAQYSMHRSMLTPCVGTALRAVGIEKMSFRHWLNTSHANMCLSPYTSLLYDSPLFKLLASARKRSYPVTYPFCLSMKSCGWVK